MPRIATSVTACMFVLSACTSAPIPPTLPATTCDAGTAAWAVGKVASAAVIERVRIDSHARVVRVLRPGQMVTMEFSPERVDIRVDSGNVVLAVSCG